MGVGNFFFFSKNEAFLKKVIFRFSALNLARKNVWCLDTFSKKFLLTSLFVFDKNVSFMCANK